MAAVEAALLRSPILRVTGPGVDSDPDSTGEGPTWETESWAHVPDEKLRSPGEALRDQVAKAGAGKGKTRQDESK